MAHSETTIIILSLLNNAKDLLFHSDRQNAQKVLKAVKIYSHENGINLSDEKFETFDRILLDSRENTLKSLIDNIANEVITIDRKSKLKKIKTK